MFHQPNHYHNLSMRLSEVLQDIGVTENMVKKTRRGWMINESLNNIASFLNNEPRKVLFLGSRSEASTIHILESDMDILYYLPDIQVIQDMSQRRNELQQYLMIQDETTSPGYCKLQWLGDDHPPFIPEFYGDKHTRNSQGQILLTNTCPCSESRRHGPAHITVSPLKTDLVYAIYCPFWPREAETWLYQQNVSGWPTEDMKHYSERQGCFVVAVASRRGIYQNLEWRISTSIAERCMMYSLNITQIRCYILMKMIIKTFLQPKFEEVISSFMCKNILFRCIAASAASSTWNEGSLLTWLNQCLQNLLNCILTENCPHFVIPGNNLLDGKLSAEVKSQLANVILSLTENIDESLRVIKIENLGDRLRVKSWYISAACSCTAFKALSVNSLFTTAILQDYIISLFQDVDTTDQCLRQYAERLRKVYLEGTDFDRATTNLIAPFLFTIKGSVTASEDIYRSHKLSSEALELFDWGLNSDLFTGRLKLASALYCAGDLEKCELILADLTKKASRTSVVTCCICHQTYRASLRFWKDCYENNYDVIKEKTAFCVRFSPNEVNCIPDELKYEMNRYSKEDRQILENENLDGFFKWKEYAVVESTSYMYFLQYKVYRQFNREADKLEALKNLARTIITQPNAFHKETTLNLLGQCMEQENREQDALCCYEMSLKIQPKCNVAKRHESRMDGRSVRRNRSHKDIVLESYISKMVKTLERQRSAILWEKRVAKAKDWLLACLKTLFPAAFLIFMKMCTMYYKA